MQPGRAAALQRLAQYDWPGNVRELKNLIERSLILGYYADDFAPVAEHIGFALHSERGGTGREAVLHETPGAVPPAPTFEGNVDSLEAIERQHILAILATAGGNKTEAARRLGISRKTLERKCAAWGVG